MSRRDLIRHLRLHGCYLLREGGSHSIFRNETNGHHAPVPRHREVRQNMVRQICRELGIPLP